MRRMGLGVALALQLLGCKYDNTTELPGDSEAFTPIRYVKQSVAYSGEDPHLIGMRATGVLPNGTLNLEAEYHPRVEYEVYARPTAADIKKKASPALPPGMSAEKKKPYALVEVTASNPRWIRYTLNGKQKSEKHQGLSREPSSERYDKSEFADAVAPLPRCSLLSLWKQVLAQGSYQNDSATIKYDKQGYTLKLNGAKRTFAFSQECAMTRGADPSQQRPQAEAR